MDYLQNTLKFLDSQMLQEPSFNSQVGFDFQGLRRSFREDPTHPDSKMVAHFGRIWIYDVALSIYADLKANRIRSAGYQAGRAMQLARQEEQKGFRGLWHFSYNTREDTFIDPRGPTGANSWCLNALYSYILANPDSSVLAWANKAVREFLFPLQVMDPGDPRYGLIRAGLYNADDSAQEETMGYRVYEGDLNARFEHVILEHCADVAGTFRLAFRASRKFVPQERPFMEELIHRHDLLMQAMRRCFWREDHFVSALDPEGRFYAGTDGLPSIAVDNNTWSAYVWLPYDLELARLAIRYVEEKFLVQAPPAHVENTAQQNLSGKLRGVYYFPQTFSDPFVQVPDEHRPKMERLLQLEATFGFVLFLTAVAKVVADAKEKERLERQAQELYRDTVALQRLYGESGAPYASANVPAVFSTLHSITTAATGVVTAAILKGAPADDFIGVAPPPEFTVSGQSPRSG